MGLFCGLLCQLLTHIIHKYRKPVEMETGSVSL